MYQQGVTDSGMTSKYKQASLPASVRVKVGEMGMG